MGVPTDRLELRKNTNTHSIFNSLHCLYNKKLNTTKMPNNKGYKLSTTKVLNNKSYKLSTTIMPNDNGKKETITQVLVMVLKSFKKFFNGSTIILKV